MAYTYTRSVHRVRGKGAAMAKNDEGFLSQLLGTDDVPSATASGSVPTRPFDEVAQVPTTPFSYDPDANAQISGGGVMSGSAQAGGSSYYGGQGSGQGSAQQGYDQQPPSPYAQDDFQQYPTLEQATAASGAVPLVMGIIALAFPIFGIIFAFVGVGSANRVLAVNPNSGTATVGKVLCWIAIVLWGLILLLGFAGLGLFMFV